jgi:hypothetical protein
MTQAKEITLREACDEINRLSRLLRAAEARAERYRAALEAVEKWFSRPEDGYPIYDHWGDGTIGDWDDNQWDWDTVLASVRDSTIPLYKLGAEIREWDDIEEITLYRQILAALSGQRQAALGSEVNND